VRPAFKWKSFRIEDEADFKPINGSNTPKATFAVKVVYKKRCAFCQVAGFMNASDNLYMPLCVKMSICKDGENLR